MIKKITIQLLICMLLTSQIIVAQDLPVIELPKIPVYLESPENTTIQLPPYLEETSNINKAFYSIYIEKYVEKERTKHHLIKYTGFVIGIFLAASDNRDIMESGYFSLTLALIFTITGFIWEAHWFSRLHENDITATEDGINE